MCLLSRQKEALCFDRRRNIMKLLVFFIVISHLFYSELLDFLKN